MKKAALILIAAGDVNDVLCGLRRKDYTTVRLNEVTRSVFYAPQYVALNLGFFEEEGLKIDITSGQGADKVMTAVLSGAGGYRFFRTGSCHICVQ